MITGIQIVAVVFSFLMLYITFLHFKRRELTTRETLFFGLLWVGAIFLTIFPKSVDFLLKTFRILRLMDLATIVGFMVLIALSFHNFLTIRKLEEKIEKLVRYNALNKIDKPEGDEKLS
ncbi:MAG: DUF2304 domain-containing protein [Chloroflexi bacterium]|nr:DUF2304 domain-containing protein [Chloroflexota bacterium]MCL5075305.1 DUF2304 domain-containing protein [Chloroflexota bacterium]